MDHEEVKRIVELTRKRYDAIDSRKWRDLSCQFGDLKNDLCPSRLLFSSLAFDAFLVAFATLSSLLAFRYFK